MKFDEIERNGAGFAKSPNDVARFIVVCLCGKDFDRKLSEKEEGLLSTLIDNARIGRMNYMQANQLLLLLNQNIVGKAFFRFFFGKDDVTLDELKEGITRFRGFAMLCFGNFRFAFQSLSQMDEVELQTELLPYCEPSSEREAWLRNRSPKMLEINRISKDIILYVGEISGKRLNKEAEVLEEEVARADAGKSRFKKNELLDFRDQLLETRRRAEDAQKRALVNTDIYLTWDSMDVYVATSMRNKWEYEETFDFIKGVFSDPVLKRLNIRYFDPTQSKCTNARDKGLVEGLMLKRALCAIYLAQESDTMGKDSELAATLAQGKPVIAYVPKHNPQQYSQKIVSYPLDFFRKRLQILDAEDILTDPECKQELIKCDKNFEDTIEAFLTQLDEYQFRQPFTLWTEKEEQFKKKCALFPRICRIVSTAECYNFDNRARLLEGRHPLCMQVNLQSGVANGVLVVRNPKDCSRLLHRILTNQMAFTMKNEEGYTSLEEEISKCAFRVVTDYERLTNSFWNLYHLG